MGILAVTLVFGITLVGCGEDPGGKYTISLEFGNWTGSNYNEVRIGFWNEREGADLDWEAELEDLPLDFTIYIDGVKAIQDGTRGNSGERITLGINGSYTAKEYNVKVVYTAHPDRPLTWFGELLGDFTVEDYVLYHPYDS